MKEKIEFEANYPHPPEKVWKALTQSQALSEWLMAGDFSAIEGAEFSFHEHGLNVSGTVWEVVPHQKLSYTWISKRDDDDAAGTPSLVTWTLKPTDKGTAVRMEHEMLQPAKAIVLIEAAVNWSFAIHSSLYRALAGRHSQPIPIVYVQESPKESEKESDRRAGFRQPEGAMA